MTEHCPILPDYNSQLEDKKQKVSEIFSAFSRPHLEVFASPSQHYRMRAEFRIWHEGQQAWHCMFDAKTKKRYKVKNFPIGSQLINTLIQEITKTLCTDDVLRRKLFRIDYLTSLSGEAVVSLLYHRKLDDQWAAQANHLQQTLRQKGLHVHVVGRARKQKIVLDQEFVIEKLKINKNIYSFKQVESSFTQPNARINEKMIAWVKHHCASQHDDLLELYCGSGNFSIPLAENYRKILATEICKPAVYAAQDNIAANNIDNLTIVRLSAEELIQAMQGVRRFNRLAHVDLSTYNCNTVLVDPPRSGLDEKTLDMLKGFKRIIYISCNPITLKDNLFELCQTHAIEHMALFDQFPYTHHMELGVLLTQHN